MKELFDTVRTALIATGDWKYIDANDGQLDNGDDFALLPAALIDLDEVPWEAGDETYQMGMARFSVEYAYRKINNGSNLTADKSYKTLMGRFDTVKKATAALIGKSGTMHGRINRFRTERIKHKEYWIVKESYLCTMAESFN